MVLNPHAPPHPPPPLKPSRENEHRKAQTREEASQDDVPENAVKWKGRFESYPAGHGFLRWNHWDPSIALTDGPNKRGAYVAASQVARFGLEDGDMVSAIVRPPRTAAEQYKHHPERMGERLRDETSWALLRVLCKERTEKSHTRLADSTKDLVEGVLPGEGVMKWTGRFEAYARGHGFLRAMDTIAIDSETLAHIDALDCPGPERGVYVALSQVQRFKLTNGDVVRALIRPPRSKEKRFYGESMPSKDEHSWSVVRLLDVNQATATSRDQGSSKEVKMEPSGAFEWKGIFELWNQGEHGFLRPSDQEQQQDEHQDRTLPSADGVYVSPHIVKEHSLLNGDLVRASVKGRDRSSTVFTLLEILEVTRMDDRDCTVMRGTLELFQRGYGFVRPAKDSTVEKWLRKGAYIPIALVKRYTLQAGSNIEVKVRPQRPEDRSPTVVEVTQATNVWELLGNSGDAQVDAEEETPWSEFDDVENVRQESNASTNTMLSIYGLRLHGTVTRLDFGKDGLNFGFIKVDHADIEDDVYFHWSSVKNSQRNGPRYIPHERQSAFFKVRRNESNSKLQAEQVTFLENALPHEARWPQKRFSTNSKSDMSQCIFPTVTPPPPPPPPRKTRQSKDEHLVPNALDVSINASPYMLSEEESHLIEARPASQESVPTRRASIPILENELENMSSDEEDWDACAWSDEDNDSESIMEHNYLDSGVLGRKDAHSNKRKIMLPTAKTKRRKQLRKDADSSQRRPVRPTKLSQYTLPDVSDDHAHVAIKQPRPSSRGMS